MKDKAKSKKILPEMHSDFSMKGARRSDAPGNIRAGQLVKGSRSNIFSDQDAEASAEPSSAVVFLRRKDGKILAVSRPDDASDLNMPGGGIEPGESPEDAARRELWEETGLIASDLIEVYRDERTVAFRALSASGKPRGSEEGLTAWVDSSTLSSGRYGEFFKNMMKKLAL